ncbi:MAG: hypothetical protein ACUVSQ_00185 [Pseudanabaenaceae cyanobacterium]
MTKALALAELQQNLQDLQSRLAVDPTAAIAEGLAFCQHFETHKQRYLPSTWLSSTVPTLVGGTLVGAVSAENLAPKTESQSQVTLEETQGKTQNEKVKNAAEKGRAADHSSDDFSTVPVSTAPEEQMLSHYVELTRHMRLLAADFSMFRAARNPSTQKSRQQQIQQRLAMLLTYCQYLLAASA